MTDDYKVIRTVSIPSDIDGLLRELAFTRGVNINSLILEFVMQGLVGCEPTLAERVSARANKKKSNN